MVLERCDFQGTNMYAAMCTEGGRTDVRSCRVAGSTMTGVAVSDAGSRLRFDASTEYRSRRARLDDLTPAQLAPMEVGRSGSGGASSSTAVDSRSPTGYRGAQVEGDNAAHMVTQWGVLGCLRRGGRAEKTTCMCRTTSGLTGDDDADSTAGVRWLTVTHEHGRPAGKRALDMGLARS